MIKFYLKIAMGATPVILSRCLTNTVVPALTISLRAIMENAFLQDGNVTFGMIVAIGQVCH